MTVLARWIDWRERAKVEVAETASLSFDDATGTINRASGSFVTAGFEAGMYGVVSGSSSNDDTIFVFDSVSAASITIDPNNVTTEGAGSVTLTAWHVDPDGVPEYPGPYGSGSNLVRSGGFTGLGATIEGVPYEGVDYEITCNSGAADASYLVPEYDWYLSQRTDDPAFQWLALTQKATTVSASYSGTVTLSHTALATTELGISANSITVDAFLRLLRHVALYVRRRSDGAIQWVPLLETMMPR